MKAIFYILSGLLILYLGMSVSVLLIYAHGVMGR